MKWMRLDRALFEGLTLALALLLAAGSSRAQAGTTERCMADHERAQMLAQQGGYLEASAAALSCAQAECPGLLRADCSQLYGELQRSLASLVLAVRDTSGRDLVSVHVVANGKPLAEQVDGRAISVDPGVYKLRFEAAGYRPVERDITLRTTEKDRLISVELAPLVEPLAGRVTPLTVHTAELPASRAPTPVVYGVGALGAVGVALAVGFGVAGKRGYRHRERSCKPMCTDGEIADVRRNYIIANTAAAVGGVALVSALALYWLRSRQSERSSSLGLQLEPLRTGAWGAVHARF